MDELGDAADSIAAHFAFAAIGVEHLHPRISRLARPNQDQAIATDTESSMRYLARQFGQIIREGL